MRPHDTLTPSRKTIREERRGEPTGSLSGRSGTVFVTLAK